MFSNVTEADKAALKEVFPAPTRFYPWTSYSWIALPPPKISLKDGKNILTFRADSGSVSMRISCSVPKRNSRGGFRGVKGRVTYLADNELDTDVMKGLHKNEVRIFRFRAKDMDLWVMVVAQPALSNS